MLTAGGGDIAGLGLSRSSRDRLNLGEAHERIEAMRAEIDEEGGPG